MVIMDPQRIVWLNQRQKLVRQHGVNPQISLPGFALKADQIKAIVESRPQHGVRELVVVFIMVPFIKVERRPGNIPAGDLLERLLVIANLAAPAKPQTPAALSAPRMPTARPPALDFLSSGKAIRLETTTKRLMVIPPFGLRVIRQMLQPRPYSGGIRQPPVRLSFPAPTFTDIPCS